MKRLLCKDNCLYYGYQFFCTVNIGNYSSIGFFNRTAVSEVEKNLRFGQIFMADTVFCNKAKLYWGLILVVINNLF